MTVTTLRHPLALLAVLLLAGCSSLNPFADRDRPCPKVEVLGDAATVTRFNSPDPGADLTDMVMQARIEVDDVYCVYETEDDGSAKATVEIQPKLKVLRGPAADSSVEVDYFTTLTDFNRNIIDKSVFNTTVTFQGNTRSVSFIDETIVVEIDLYPEETEDDFIVFLGFQLTPEQLRYNMFKRGGGTD